LSDKERGLQALQKNSEKQDLKEVLISIDKKLEEREHSSLEKPPKPSVGNTVYDIYYFIPNGE
jgi:hypothetical protein